MAQLVVHLLELVQLRQHQPEPAVMPPGGAQLLAQSMLEEAAVVQPAEPIELGLLGKHVQQRLGAKRRCRRGRAAQPGRRG
jgi:hypothetical protein